MMIITMMMMIMTNLHKIIINDLQHRLDVHHVEVRDNCPVDHHDLVPLDDPCNHDHDVDEEEDC